MYSQRMTAAPDPLLRLAQYLERRIVALTLEYAEVCRRAGISDETLGKIRKGHKARGSTYSKLERALEWQQGSIASILNGGEPAEVESRPGAGGPDDAESEQDTPTLSQELALASRILSATVREIGLSPDEAEEAWRRARLEIERTHKARTRDEEGRTPQGRSAI